MKNRGDFSLHVPPQQPKPFAFQPQGQQGNKPAGQPSNPMGINPMGQLDPMQQPVTPI